MANVNKVILIGHVTRNPAIRYIPKGTAVIDFVLAINRYYSVGGNEKKEETVFIEVTLWGRQAEVAGEYLKKGSAVYIEGRLQMDAWDDKQTGQKRTRLRVVAENFQLLWGRPTGGAADATAESRQTSAPPKASASAEPDEDEIPF